MSVVDIGLAIELVFAQVDYMGIVIFLSTASAKMKLI